MLHSSLILTGVGNVTRAAVVSEITGVAGSGTVTRSPPWTPARSLISETARNVLIQTIKNRGPNQISEMVHVLAHFPTHFFMIAALRIAYCAS
eukprot:g45316.t1